MEATGCKLRPGGSQSGYIGRRASGDLRREARDSGGRNESCMVVGEAREVWLLLRVDIKTGVGIALRYQDTILRNYFTACALTCPAALQPPTYALQFSSRAGPTIVGSSESWGLRCICASDLLLYLQFYLRHEPKSCRCQYANLVNYRSKV